jgi:hypothetical protein
VPSFGGHDLREVLLSLEYPGRDLPVKDQQQESDREPGQFRYHAKF